MKKMKNKDYYAERLKRGRLCVKADLTSPWKESVCNGDCNGCMGRFLSWLDDEAVLITLQEKEFLKMISTEFKYIVRDEDGSLYLYKKKPRKGADMWFEVECRLISGLNKNALKGIRWEDDEPFCIDDFVER